MEKVQSLVIDLTNLNNRYNELNPRGWDNMSLNKEELEAENKKLIESGKIIINFYQDIFKPKYSKVQGDLFKEADYLLHDLSNMAGKCVRDESYFGLGVLLTPKGSKNSDPNLLEELIEKAKKQL